MSNLALLDPGAAELAHEAPAGPLHLIPFRDACVLAAQRASSAIAFWRHSADTLGEWTGHDMPRVAAVGALCHATQHGRLTEYWVDPDTKTLRPVPESATRTYTAKPQGASHVDVAGWVWIDRDRGAADIVFERAQLHAALAWLEEKFAPKPEQRRRGRRRMPDVTVIEAEQDLVDVKSALDLVDAFPKARAALGRNVEVPPRLRADDAATALAAAWFTGRLELWADLDGWGPRRLKRRTPVVFAGPDGLPIGVAIAGPGFGVPVLVQREALLAVLEGLEPETDDAEPGTAAA